MNHADYRTKSYYIPADIIKREVQNPILRSLSLVWTGLYTSAYGHTVQNRTLGDYVLIYCVEGKGFLILNGKTYEINKGDMFFCPPGISHSYSSDIDNPWTKYWVHFNGETAKAYMELVGISAENPVLHLGNDVKITSWFHDIFSVMTAGYTQSNILVATSHLISILCYINTRNLRNGCYKNNDDLLSDAIAYMQSHIHSDLSLTQLAQNLNISKYYLSRLFKQKIGYTPIDYYIRLKMQKACELLETTNMKIHELSSDLGFENPYYFSSTFKRIIGKSPNFYKMTVKQGESS